MVAALAGRWLAGVVRGHLREAGWGAGLGYPGLAWDPDGPEVTVRVLEAEGLPADWPRIDDFEGADYRRILVPVELDANRVVVANLYEATARP